MAKISLVRYLPTTTMVFVVALGSTVLTQSIAAVSTKGAWNIGQAQLVAEHSTGVESEFTEQVLAQENIPAKSEVTLSMESASIKPAEGSSTKPAEGSSTKPAEGSPLTFSESAVNASKEDAAGGATPDAIEPEKQESREKPLITSTADQPNELLETIVGGPIDVEQAKKNASLETRLLMRDLDRQYKQLRKSLETEDAYSEKLGENYFSYGLLLRQASRYPEAVDAFIDALHISKINNGLYSLRQRAVLKALFDTYFQTNDVEEYEDYLERILWIERKNPEVIDDTSFQMLTMVGNQYLDQFLRHPIAGQSSVQTLLRAKNHFLAAVHRHGNKPLTEILMPYGELALISFLESRMQPNVDKTSSMDDHRLRRSRYLDGRDTNLISYFEDSYPEGEAYLKDYLRKAIAEKKPRHAIYALISLGDLGSLFKENSDASNYYHLAQRMANETGHSDILANSFSEPVALPDFQYSVFREPVLPTRTSVLVPLFLQVNELGQVDQVAKLPADSEYALYYSKARRAARRLIFRPKFIDGKAVAVNELSHDIRVYPRRRK